MLIGATLGGCVEQLDHRPLIDPVVKNSLLFRDVRVFTASKDGVLGQRDVLVANGRIAQIAETGTLSVDEAMVIDGRGKTLLPGLIDLHVHIGASAAPPSLPALPDPEHNLQAYLFGGVTTVLDLGGSPNKLRRLKEQQQRGKIVGPRILYAGATLTAEDGHPVALLRDQTPGGMGGAIARKVARELSDAEDAAEAVAEQHVRGASLIKLACDELPVGTPVLSDELLRAGIEAAHNINLKAVVHVGRADNALSAVRAGADALVHVPYMDAVSEEQAQEILGAGPILIPTLSAWNRVADVVQNKLVFSELDRQIGHPEVLASLSVAASERDSIAPALMTWLDRVVEAREMPAKNTRALHEAGLRVLVGTDSSVTGNLPGASIHEELALLVDAGLSPVEALLGATARAANFLGLEGLGVITQGATADLLLVDGRPDKDISATANIALVVQNGVVMKRLMR
jgi:imidazolonepropionase-like amidohydrolase